MKKLSVLTTLPLLASSVFASPVYHPPGPSLGYGNVTNGTSIISDITNPAAGAATMDREGESLYRFGILSSIGAGYEFGDVDNMFDQIDEASLLIEDSFNNVIDAATIDGAMTQLQSNLNTANSLLVSIEDAAYAKFFTSVHVPVFPLVISHKALGGSWVLDLNISLFANASTVYDTVDFVTDINPVVTHITNNDGTTATFGDVSITTNGDPINPQYSYLLNNDSTVLLKGAGITEAALGYSTGLFDTPFGKLYAGVRGKYYQVTLLQEIEKVNDTTDAQSTFDNIEPDDGETSNAIGLDGGVLLVASNYRLGATWRNINEPEFDYNTLDLSLYQDGPVKSQLQKTSSYTMESQLSFEAALFNEAQDLMLNLAFDANAVMDPVGDEVQWASATIAYTGGFILPGIRGGIRKNMSGSELTYTTLGFTFFKVLNLDFAVTQEKIEDEGESIPRGGMFNLGVEMTF